MDPTSLLTAFLLALGLAGPCDVGGDEPQCSAPAEERAETPVRTRRSSEPTPGRYDISNGF